MKKYWQSLEEYKSLVEAKDKAEITAQRDPSNELAPDTIGADILGKPNRRNFLKMLGFTLGYTALATSCETPVRKAIPYLNQPEEIKPGVANYYASTFFDGHDYCSILVKTREGRPIKIEGNDLSSISQCGTSARVQASVLNLYDEARSREPMKGNENSSWDVVDADIIKQLTALATNGQKIVLLTSTIISPSTQQLINDFIEKFPSTEWITYDAISASAMLEANEMNFGVKAIPSYHFDKAKLIVGFNADFLGNWLMPVSFTKQYAKGRKLLDGQTNMSRHIQYESYMSLTGSNADIRVQIKPLDEAVVLLNLYNEIAKQLGAETHNVSASPVDVVTLAHELLAHKGESLLVQVQTTSKSSSW